MMIHRIRKTLVMVAAGAALAFAPATLAWARTNYALVVGVSKYPDLDEKLWLAGPRNDATMVRDFLESNTALQFSPDHVVTLADGVDGAADPTSAHIRQAFADLAAKVEPGDFVYLHFSGHGSQAPARVPGEEQDGLDELFLPSDVSGWDKQTGTIQNALVDDDIGTMINAILDKGANVWAVFDSCHSGTVTRDAGLAGDPLDAEKSRKVDPLALGIPQEALDAAEVRTRGGGVEPESAIIETAEQDGRGKSVFFYAAQTSETTPEMRLPAGDPDRVSHGLFTFTLFETLAQNPALTYRQLGEEVLRRYSSEYRVQPTPLFEGALDAGVFGMDTSGSSRLTQWPVRQDGMRMVVDGGRLNGLAAGDELVLLPGPIAKDDERIATIKITSTTDFNAQFKAEDGGIVTIEPGYYARKLGSPTSFEIRVALPDAASTDPAAMKAVQPVLDGLAKAERAGLRLQLVGAGDRPDIQIVAEDGQLWLLPPGAALTKSGPEKTISIGYANRDPSETLDLLADSLARIARVTNLIRLGDQFAQGQGGAGGLDIGYYIESGKTGERRKIEPPAVPRLEVGDTIYLEAHNKTNRTLDLNMLYVGSTYSIDFIYNWRIQPNGTERDVLGDIVPGAYGRERLLSIVTAAEPQSATADFSWLAQPALDRTREVRGGEKGGFGDMLVEAGFGETTRTLGRRSNADANSGIGQVLLDIIPPASE